MFDDPQCYSIHSGTHQEEMKWALDQVLGKLRWIADEKVLDIGCGTGDATHNILLPAIPNCGQLVGVDMNDQMLEHARTIWDNPKLSFKVVDIGTKIDPLKIFDEDIRKYGGFDKIFSFFCLHWVKDRKILAENLYKLLKPGGQGYVQFIVRAPIFNTWDKMTTSEKWGPYLKDVKTPMNEYVYIDHPEEAFKEALTSAGLSVDECILVDRPNIFTPKSRSLEDIKVKAKTVDPFLSLLPEDRKDEYIDDLVETGFTIASYQQLTDYTSLMVLFSKKGK